MPWSTITADNLSTLEESHFRDGIEVILRVDDQMRFCELFVREHTDLSTREALLPWIQSRLDRLVDHGPEPDGWGHYPRTHSYQLQGRSVQMPGI